MDRRHVPESNPRKMDLFCVWNHQGTLFSSSSSTSNRNLDHRHDRRGSCGGGVGSKAALFFQLSHFSVSFVKDVYIQSQS